MRQFSLAFTTIGFILFSRTCIAFMPPLTISSKQSTKINKNNVAFSQQYIKIGRIRDHVTSSPIGMSEIGDNENSSDDDNISKASAEEDSQETCDPDDDMTDRFKFKVRALMGCYDPLTGVDDENQDGNILNAMMEFPTRYTFNIVGKTGEDEETKEKYINDVKNAVLKISGDIEEDGEQIQCKITPRGKKFTKIQCDVRVESTGMINSIYDELDTLELTVMRF